VRVCSVKQERIQSSCFKARRSLLARLVAWLAGSRIDAPRTEGVPMPVLHCKVGNLNTLAVARSPIVLALSLGLGGLGIVALPTAAAAILPSPGLSDRVLKVHGSHRDCQYGIYRRDGRRREGWHRYQDGDIYTCTPSSSSGTPGSSPGVSRSTGGTGGGSRDGSRSGGGDKIGPSAPPSFGARAPTEKSTASRGPARFKKRVESKTSSHESHSGRSRSRSRRQH
jgi:hypothetical protein